MPFLLPITANRLSLAEGSFEVKLPVGKAEVGIVREEKRRREKIREEKK